MVLFSSFDMDIVNYLGVKVFNNTLYYCSRFSYFFSSFFASMLAHLNFWEKFLIPLCFFCTVFHVFIDLIIIIRACS